LNLVNAKCDKLPIAEGVIRSAILPRGLDESGKICTADAAYF